ncbi:MAG: AI-2E family transporter [Opitutaceae bacterium]
MPTLAQEPTQSQSVQRFITLASYALVIGILWVGQTVIMPIVFAALLAFLLSPAVRRLMRWRVPKSLAITAVVLAVFAVVGGLGWVMGTQMLHLAEELPAYERNILQKVAALKSPATPPALERTSAMIKKLQREIQDNVPQPPPTPADANGRRQPGEPEPVRVRVEERQQNSLELLGSTVETVAGPLAQTGVILVLFVAMLVAREDLRDRFIKVVSAGRINLATQALDDAARRVMRYLLMQLVVNAIYGVPVGIGLYLIGVPNAPLWGLLATLLRYIPFLGPWIAASFPVLLAFAVDPGWSMLISTLVLFLVMELVSNNFIEVWLYGAGTGISNLALLVAAVFWTALWGPVGLVLSTPLTVCLLVLGKHVPGLWFLSTLLGSEPVLEPPAQFYQRMLSMDSDEMQDLATSFIKSRSLGAFYDEMFLPALLLAEEDRHSGALAEVRQQFIFRAGRELIEELERRGETDRPSTSPAGVASPTGKDTVGPPPPPTHPDSTPLVWGVPASDDADELAGLMLGHLLRDRGLRVVVSPVEESPQEQSERLLRDGTAVVFVSALPPSALGAARRACRWIKETSPRLPVVVGIWTGAATPRELELRLHHPKPEAVVTQLGSAVQEIERWAREHPSATRDASPDPQVPAPDAPVPVEDHSRRLGLTALEPEAWVERVTRALAQAFEVPVSLVSLIDTEEAFWPPRLGLRREGDSLREPLLRAFLRELASEEDLLAVEDAKKDRRMAQKPFVTERGVRLFVGLVLRTPAGHAMGYLCLLDTEPHTITDDQRALVRLYGNELVEAVASLSP